MDKIVSLFLDGCGLALLVEPSSQAEEVLCAEDGVTRIRKIYSLSDLGFLP